MATNGTGSAVINFGAAPGGNRAQAVITGIADINAGANVEAWMQGESSADHNAYEHTLVPIKLACSDVQAGIGFTINGTCEWRLTGAFTVRYVWSN